MNNVTRLLIGLLLTTWLLCSGCAGDPYVYVPDSERMGPGLFSGPDGEITIYRANREIRSESGTITETESGIEPQVQQEKSP